MTNIKTHTVKKTKLPANIRDNNALLLKISDISEKIPTSIWGKLNQENIIYVGELAALKEKLFTTPAKLKQVENLLLPLNLHHCALNKDIKMRIEQNWQDNGAQNFIDETIRKNILQDIFQIRDAQKIPTYEDAVAIAAKKFNNRAVKLYGLKNIESETKDLQQKNRIYATGEHLNISIGLTGLFSAIVNAHPELKTEILHIVEQTVKSKIQSRLDHEVYNI